MKQKKKFTNSLIRPIFNSIIGLVIVLSAAIGFAGYFEFADAFKQQYIEITNGIAENVALGINPDKIDAYLKSKKADEEYNSINEQIQNIADSEGCSVIYVAKVHTDTKEREYVYNVVSKTSGFTPYIIGYRDTVGDKFLTAYESILNGEADIHNFMYEKSGYTTSIYPIINEDKNVIAIVGVVKNMDLLNGAKRNYIIRIIIIEAIIAIISGGFWVVYFKKRIVVPIRKVSNAALNMVEHLEDGTSPEIVVKSNDEIKDLADSFTKMYNEMGEYIKRLEIVTAEKERIGVELDVAAKIQSSMLPCIFPAFPNRKEFDIYASMNPAKEVGGDFYDFFMVDENHIAFVVADVSGKGVPAALFMVIGKTLIKDHTGLNTDLGEVFTQVNDILCASNSEEMFITAFEGVLDLNTGELRYVNAGHETPFVCRKNGVFEPFKVKSGFVLAGMENIKYKSGSIMLNPGDKIFQYSDGIPEAINTRNEQYGMMRLEKVLSQNSKKTPTELLHVVKEDVDNFVGEGEQFDDITMLCLEFKGKIKTDAISVEPNKDSISKVLEFTETTLDKWNIPMKFANKIQIAVDEIFSNIINYSEAKKAKLTIMLESEKLTLLFEDDGKVYDPTIAKEPNISSSVDDREIGGLGIFMVKKLSSNIKYENNNGKNILTILFEIK